MLRLREVHIRRYRAVAPDTKLRFGDEQVFLLGRNGSGKSTLLELLATLIACDVSALRAEDDPVDVEWVLEWATEPLDGTATHRLRFRFVSTPAPESPLAAEPDISDSPDRFNAALVWKLDGSLSRFADDGEIVLRRFGYQSNALPVFEPASFTSEAVRTRPPPDPTATRFIPRLARYLAPPLVDSTGRHRTRANAPTYYALVETLTAFDTQLSRFDEALSHFERVTGTHERDRVTIEAGPNHLERSYISRRLFFALQIESGDNLADIDLSTTSPSTLLLTIARLLGAQDVSLHPRLQQRDAKGRSLWRGFDLYITWPGGLMHRHEQLSFGQKRLIAFLWYADVFAQLPLLTDELTNGLHSSWVRELVDLLDGRQAFHAVQNPLLLDMSGPGAEDKVVGRFVLCEPRASEEGRTWSWRNPTAHEAERLYRAWDAGFQHLSEVLVSEGLW